MLSTLTIKNFVLIEDAEIEFAPGLNVLTGETGAGKTLLTKALGLLMGERAEDGLVGNNGAEATIQAIFDLDETAIGDLAEDLVGLLGGVEPGPFIVARRLGREGRNRCYLNGSAVTLNTIGRAVGVLLSFAGQHEYRRLLEPQYQLSVLDKWVGDETLALLATFRDSYLKAKDAAKRLEDSSRDEQARLREIELLRFQVQELTEADLSLGEEEELLAEQKRLARAEDLLRASAGAANVLNADNEAADVSTLFGQAGSLLANVRGVDADLDAMESSLTDAAYRVGELARELHSYSERVSVDPTRLQLTDERLRLYTELGRKYGGSTEAAIAVLQDGRERLAYLEGGEADVSRLEEVRAAETARALKLAGELSEARNQAIPLLEQAVAEQLTGLGMSEAKVSIALESRSDWEALSESGGDRVEFMLAANPGLPARSLAKTASGGELSRVLLALKCALAGAGGNETLVFDEVDAGIGGRTAVSVGEKLRELSTGSQLLVITHLAQVAAVASRHFVIDKVAGESDTVARLFALEDEQVTEELCRMLGGRPDNSESMALAREMRDRAAAGLID